MIVANSSLYKINKTDKKSFEILLDKVCHPHISKKKVTETEADKLDNKIVIMVDSISSYDLIHMMPRIERNGKPKLNLKQKLYLNTLRYLINKKETYNQLNIDNIFLTINIDIIDQITFEELFPILLCENRVIGYILLENENKFILGIQNSDNNKNLFLLSFGIDHVSDIYCPTFDLTDGFKCPYNCFDWSNLNNFYKAWEQNDYDGEMFPVIEVAYE